MDVQHEHVAHATGTWSSMDKQHGHTHSWASLNQNLKALKVNR
jgi:hypothetical protein